MSFTPASRKASDSCASSQTDCGLSRRFFTIVQAPLTFPSYS